LDVKRSSWLLRHIIKRSPAGEPAALAAATYVALRAVALRAAHPTDRYARRSGAPLSPPPSWLPDTRPLAAELLAPLRARGVVALVTRTASDRLGGVAAAVTLGAPADRVGARLRDPALWRAFPGWKTVRVQPGTYGLGASVEDDLPLVDCDDAWVAQPGAEARWIAAAGATRGSSSPDRSGGSSSRLSHCSKKGWRSRWPSPTSPASRRPSSRLRDPAGSGRRRNPRKSEWDIAPPRGAFDASAACRVPTRRDNGYSPCCLGVTCHGTSGETSAGSRASRW